MNDGIRCIACSNADSTSCSDPFNLSSTTSVATTSATYCQVSDRCVPLVVGRCWGFVEIGLAERIDYPIWSVDLFNGQFDWYRHDVLLFGSRLLQRRNMAHTVDMGRVLIDGLFIACLKGNRSCSETRERRTLIFLSCVSGRKTFS